MRFITAQSCAVISKSFCVADEVFHHSLAGLKKKSLGLLVKIASTYARSGMLVLKSMVLPVCRAVLDGLRRDCQAIYSAAV